MMKSPILQLEATDNVVVALENLTAGTTVTTEGFSIEVKENIKAKHKMALHDFNIGDAIVMYGLLVGKATEHIAAGTALHVDNVKHSKSEAAILDTNYQWTSPNITAWQNRTFMGYHRADGQVGTENVWLFFPLVFCENKNIEALKEVFEKELGISSEMELRNYFRSLIGGREETHVEPKANPILSNISLRFLTHQGGCGGTREDAVMLAKLLAGYVNNPNVAGVTVLSLGCQNLQVEIFKKALHDINPNIEKPVLIFDQQESGNNDKMMQKIIAETFEALKTANNIVRQPAPLSKLSVGLECGGSDGFSGISANPVLGRVSDILVALKGKAILAEFPELCGVEQNLIDRCVKPQSAHRFLELMKAFEASAIKAGSGFDMNPSPGNIKDGLITDAMKSAGAAKKGGTAPIVNVADYAEYCNEEGLHLLCTPGNDVESTTALAASGTNIILFTTGLGTPTGNPVVPVIKVSSNSHLFEKMGDIIDFDAGTVITGNESLEEAADRLLNYIVDVASGHSTTKAVQNKQYDFIPWKRGVSL